jgi:hypothetical protein
MHHATGWPHSATDVWPQYWLAHVAYTLTCNYGQVDQVEAALRAFKAAQAGVPKAEQRARELIAAARAEVDKARTVLADAIVNDYLDGDRVADLARRAEYSRETIRRILRAANVDPD